MQALKTLFTTLIVGGLTFFLFVIGLGFMVLMLIIMLIASMFVSTKRKTQWQQQWSQQWAQRKQYGHRQKSQHTEVIEGQYTVVEPH